MWPFLKKFPYFSVPDELDFCCLWRSYSLTSMFEDCVVFSGGRVIRCFDELAEKDFLCLFP